MNHRTSGAAHAALLTAFAAAGMFAAPVAAQDEPPTDQADDDAREVIVVTGRAQTLYRVTETNTGKLPADTLASPLVISAINRNLIEDQGARDAQDLYRNISGVSLFSYAGVTARGFRQEEIFFDGLRGDPYAGFAVPQLFNVEQVEFLKGPAGMLYGPGAPGGLFNYITKTPSDEFSARVAGVFGTEARRGASVEVNGATPIDGVSARAGVFYENRNTARALSADEVGIYDLGVRFDLGGADAIIQATRYEQKLQANRLRGVPVDDTGRFITDRRWNHNEPDDFLDLVSNNVQARINGALGAAITWDAGVRYTESREDQEYHEPRTLTDTDGDGVFDFLSNREFRDQTRQEEALTAAANAIWSTGLGGADLRVLVGADYFTGEQTFDYDRARGPGDNVGGISLIDPVYGQSDRTTYTLTTVADGRVNEQTRAGGYALAEVTIDALTLVGGARLDRFEDDGFDDENATFRLGAVYAVRPDVSLFAHWAESYEPQGVGDQDPLRGGPFDPTTGEILEVGVKTALMNGRVQSTISVYEIVRENLLQNSGEDPGGDGFDDLIAFGEVTSQGLEIDIAADITPDWVVTASYGYNDTKVTGDADAGGTDRIRNRVGDRFANAPEHQLGFWTRYQLPRDVAVAFGGDYVDVQQSLNGQKVRPYIIFDASVMWEPGPYRALVRIDNLTDETYAESGFLARTGHFPGDPRSVFLEVSRTW